MIGARILGRQQHENQIDRPVVDGVEIHRLVYCREKTMDFFQLRQPAMRDGDTLAHAGGSKALPRQNGFKDFTRAETRDLRRGQSCRAAARRSSTLSTSSTISRSSTVSTRSSSVTPSRSDNSCSTCFLERALSPATTLSTDRISAISTIGRLF